MSKIAEFKALEAQIAEHKKRLEALQGDEGLKKEIELEGKLRKLLGEYSYSLRDVITLLDPEAGKFRNKIGEKATRRPREIKRYKNPKNGEIIETKGSNHKALKAWKEEHGAEVVETWVQ